MISAQKANTANAFSLESLALSSANLFTATQLGGSLFGLQESNPVSTEAAYGGNADDYGIGVDGVSGSGFGHPECSPDATTIGEGLPTTNPVGP